MDIWNDPVWSKVIANTLWVPITYIISFFTAIFNKVSVRNIFKEILVISFPFWLMMLIILTGIAVSFFSPIAYWSFSILAPTSIVLSKLLAKSSNADSEEFDKWGLNYKLLFEMASSQFFFFRGSGEFYWVDGKKIGSIGVGSMVFENHILDIQRNNTDGRFFIRICRYLGGQSNVEFVEKDITRAANRIIRIDFDAKTINGSHLLWFIAKKVNDHPWIHKANVQVRINTTLWKKYALSFTVPSNEDFEIWIDDREVQNPNSSVQIRNLLIQEAI